MHYRSGTRSIKKKPDLAKIRSPRTAGESVYAELNDKEWLRKKYYEELLSTGQIGDTLGCSEETVRNALIRHEIPARTYTEAAKLFVEDDGFKILNQEAFDGYMLGDASVVYPGDRQLPRFSKTNKFHSHLEYNSIFLFTKSSNHRIKFERRKSTFPQDAKKDVYHEKYCLTSLGHSFLIHEYNRWYPAWNNYEKVVPRDIAFSPLFVLSWFLDDGCSYFTPRPGGTKGVYVEFSVNGFRTADVDYLRIKFAEIGIKTAKVKSSDQYNRENDECAPDAIHGDGYYIRISQRQIDYFLDYIGPCPVPELAYKWKRPDECRLPPLGPLSYAKCFSKNEREALAKFADQHLAEVP